MGSPCSNVGSGIAGTLLPATIAETDLDSRGPATVGKTLQRTVFTVTFPQGFRGCLVDLHAFQVDGNPVLGSGGFG